MIDVEQAIADFRSSLDRRVFCQNFGRDVEAWPFEKKVSTLRSKGVFQRKIRDRFCISIL